MSEPTNYQVGSDEPYDPFFALRRAAADASEFSWGGGLTPEGLEHALPIEGGPSRSRFQRPKT